MVLVGIALGVMVLVRMALVTMVLVRMVLSGRYGRRMVGRLCT